MPPKNNQKGMKNILLIINVVLVLAVGFLYVKVFSNKETVKKTKVSTASNTTAGKDEKAGVIAYVELDSLYENIDYIKQQRTELEREQKAIETDWQNGMRGLEAKKENFLKKGDKATQSEYEQVQTELMQGQQQVESRKQNAAAKLSDKSYKFMDKIQAEMKDFLKTYNEDRKYTYILTSGTGLDYMIYRDSTLNITDEVIAGMNEVFAKQK